MKEPLRFLLTEIREKTKSGEHIDCTQLEVGVLNEDQVSLEIWELDDRFNSHHIVVDKEQFLKLFDFIKVV